MASPVYIRAFGSITPLGSSQNEIRNAYLDPTSILQKQEFKNGSHWVGKLPDAYQREVDALREEVPAYRNLDLSVLYAIYASRLAMERAGWHAGDEVGINIGSSRGATQSWEDHYSSFRELGKAQVHASPATTLGNIAYWVSHDLGSGGPNISHSITCSTALHALMNGMAWLQSGMADKFIVGGSEAALTEFTLAQMQALKIYASQDGDFPCRAMDLGKSRNSMVMGEGASVACLQTVASDETSVLIAGYGYATESLAHAASISKEGRSLEKAMRMALNNANRSVIDVVVTHAPGTIQGDRAEWTAIQQVFGKNIPAITNNKWKLGHTFGASGMLSIEMAVYMLHNQEFYPLPYVEASHIPEEIDSVMVNAVGFGGNAVSIILERHLDSR